MSEQPRKDREWEHWPGRKDPDDRIRHRLKALFASTDDEEVVEALISERGREIEERTEQLQATIADLERREEQTGRLRSAVEEMLRHGSAELDERHAALTALALELGAREEKIRAAERDVAVRKQELGAVELRSAAVARREEASDEREASLGRISAELTSREAQLAEAEGRIADLDAEIGNRQRALAASQSAVLERERRLGDQEAELARLAAEVADREQLPRSREGKRLLRTGGALPCRRKRLERTAAPCAWQGSRTRCGGPHPVRDRETGTGSSNATGPHPGLDALVEVDGREFVVSRVGRSPLPGDRRACAYLEPARRT